MSPAPILSQTARTELLRGNQKNYISVKVHNEELHRVHKPLAMRFSRVWRKTLQNPTCREVNVTFPHDPTAAQLPPHLSIDDANRFSLKFIVEWIEAGGGDSVERRAVPYPRTRPGLQRLLALAETLQVRGLIPRLTSDIARTPVHPKRCDRCQRYEHPGEECLRCWHCQELGHARRECAKYQAELPDLEKRREEWEERQKVREERRKAWEEREKARKEREEVQRQRAALEKERWERWESQRKEKMIRTGEMAVGDGGKTIVVWNPGV